MGLFSFGERDLSDVWEGLSHPKPMPGYVPAGWIDWLAGVLAQETLIMSESATHQYSSYNSACSSPYIYDSTDHSYIPRERKPRYSTSCPRSMSSRVYATVGRPSVRPSVCPIRPPHAAAAGWLLWARRPGDIDRLLHGCGPAVISSRAAGCGQCHIVSWRRKLNTDLFVLLDRVAW